jgi:hypothetical protein
MLAHLLEDMTAEELQRRGDAADALFREVVRRPSPAEALQQPFAAFPSWFLRIECDRCGKVVMQRRKGGALQQAAQCAHGAHWTEVLPPMRQTNGFSMRAQHR